MSRKLIVEVVGDTKSLDRSLNRASRNVKGFSGEIGKSGRGAIAASGAFHSLGRSVAFASASFLGAAGFVTVVKDSISAASDLHEEINKSEVVFGKASKAVEEFGKTSAESFGIAEHEAIGMAATFGNLLHPMGIARGQAAKMSVQFVKLAADLASFNNADPAEVLQAIQSGLAGQIRPLRQYGIFLSKARIEAEALSMGLLKGNVSQKAAAISVEQLSVAQTKYNAALAKYGPTATQTVSAHVTLEKAQANVAKVAAGATTALTNQQKALATTSIIMRDSADAQGDFARTSGGLANQQRILKAQIQDVEAQIGTALMPTVLHITKAMTAWLGKTENQKKIQHDLNVIVATAADLFGAFQSTVKALTPVFKGFSSAVGGTKHAFELLFALGVAAKLTAIGKSIGFIGTQATVATGEAGAATGVAGLLKNLKLLGAIGVIAITIEVYEKLIPDFKGKHYSGIDAVRDIGDKLFGIGSGPGSGNKKVDTSISATSGMGPHHAPGSGPKVQIQTGYSGHSHGTSGLPGYSGYDIATHKGEPILAPEDCTLYNPHMIPYQNLGTSKALGGWTCYLAGHETGNTYFLTHMGSVGSPGHYKRGAKIGTGGKAVNAEHVHVGIKPAGTTNISDTTNTGGTGGATHVGTTSSKSSPAWKGATQATIIAAKASVTSMIGAAKQVIGGMAGPMDEIERAAIAHLQKLKEHLHPHMTASDLARTKADIKKWGKVLNDEIAAQTKAAKRAFDQASKDLFRAFDKATAAGLKALAAPDKTPTEQILADRQSARDDAARQQALSDAIAAGDQQAIADAQYDIETARLEKIAEAERKAADEKAQADQDAYQQARDDQRQALQDQLDDWETWLTNKKKSWNAFWAWIKANPNGGNIAPPNIGSTAGAPTFGGKPSAANNGGFTQVGGGNTGGFVQVGGSNGLVIGHPIPTLATGGMVKQTGLAVVHEGETFSGVNGGGLTIHSVVNLDGKVVYENWKKHAARDVGRNGGTGVRA